MPRLNAGKTASPTMRIIQVTRRYEGGLATWLTVTRIVCPSLAWTACRVWAPSTISPAATGARPASSVRKSRPRAGSMPIAGTMVRAVPTLSWP